ncbi:amidohydrolase family protein [Vibrio sp. ZSDZ34]|uniref:Amidohydrolase family protein n=1 Tax=Vibrio gelatinilyticus TaxID=2893468 RepID=A0A9X1WEB9_9VIBR|nr:amidohydrolase family protein [Vibrio gelatinilyticus]MCJ2377648.1 amidohydrolase family protein [Vibrio gelatinilyticus]
MRIFDSHNHIWRCEGEHFAWITDDLKVIKRDFSISDLESVLADNKVEKSVLVQAVPEIWETRELLDIAEASDTVVGVIGWVDVTKGNQVGEDIASLKQSYSKLCGIRYMSQGLPPEHLMESQFVEGVKQVGNEGLIYELLITTAQLQQATKLVSQCPDMTFIVEHIAKPAIRDGEFEQWSDDLHTLAAYPNVHCKLSGIVTEADFASWNASEITPYMDAVLSAFGENRVIYGSDYPVCLLAASYPQVLTLVTNWLNDNPEVSADKILYSNAEALYLNPLTK